nr:MAG TPA: hypothetical protein [Caudoviricetes sp.]
MRDHITILRTFSDMLHSLVPSLQSTVLLLQMILYHFLKFRR